MKQRIMHGATIETATPDEVAEILREFSRAGHIAYGSDRIERTLENWPVVGHERKVRVNNSHGNANLILAAATYIEVLAANNGRGGLSLINIGANPTFIYLAPAATASEQNGMVASGYLAPGGSWDGKIGNAEWVGVVSAQSPLGTVLVVAEV